jgi:hypothetical protein
MGLQQIAHPFNYFSIQENETLQFFGLMKGKFL